MKKILIVLLLAAIAVPLTAFDGYIEIFNDTGLDIEEIYVSHESEEGWGEDLLGLDILADEEVFLLELLDFETEYFDVLLIDEDGDTYTFFDIDIELEDLHVGITDLD